MLFYLAVVTAVINALIALDLFIGNRSVRALRDQPPTPSPGAPRVSVIAAARNEERNIREALASLLALDYPDLELILVNDRSEDRTGAILEQMALTSPLLKVVQVQELPEGWLGKNHALWCGARQASGTLLLFTDADIVMAPTVLSRAVRFFQEQQLDHLVVTPRMTMPGTFLPMFGLAFVLFFSVFARPWKARDPKSSCHVGIGAFNMVRGSAYFQVGGHQTIRLRPDDDIKLGKILKKGGFAADVAYGPEYLSVEWYHTVGEVIRGLEKNAFAGCDYRISMVLAGTVFHLLCSVFPYLALFVTSGPTRMVYLGVVALLTLLLADCARFHHAKPWHALGFAPSAALFCWIILRTTVLNIVQGGIYWRGTFYKLKMLKGNMV
jgi:cellulose synthase/poly-beta-1,6-N-acetylglucosamine synthase-like glycosyltransferase